MRRLILAITAAIAAFALALPAVAQPESPIDYCNLLAQAAEAVAQDRDSGVPEHAIIRQVVRELGESPLRGDLLFVIEVVYMDPHLPPGEEAAGVFEVCWIAYGGAYS